MFEKKPNAFEKICVAFAILVWCAMCWVWFGTFIIQVVTWMLTGDGPLNFEGR